MELIWSEVGVEQSWSRVIAELEWSRAGAPILEKSVKLGYINGGLQTITFCKTMLLFFLLFPLPFFSWQEREKEKGLNTVVQKVTVSNPPFI